MKRVVFVSQDWETRALLRAQLLEDGVGVVAYLSAVEAIESLGLNASLLGLLIADLASSDDPAGEAELLASWTSQIPIWIIATHSLIVDNEPKAHGFEVSLFRPIDVGKIIEQINRRLETES